MEAVKEEDEEEEKEDNDKDDMECHMYEQGEFRTVNEIPHLGGT